MYSRVDFSQITLKNMWLFILISKLNVLSNYYKFKGLSSINDLLWKQNVVLQGGYMSWEALKRPRIGFTYSSSESLGKYDLSPGK